LVSLRLGDLAALGLAVGSRRLGVALTLAGVLARAGVTRPRTASLPLAGVDPVADDLITARLLVGPGGHGARKEQRRSRGSNGEPLRVHQSSLRLLVSSSMPRRWSAFQLTSGRRGVGGAERAEPKPQLLPGLGPRLTGRLTLAGRPAGRR